jgi:hypothetical protein
MADKYKIIEEETGGVFDEHETDITGLSNGIDRYMKETCLELLEYMAKNHIECSLDKSGNPLFMKHNGIMWESLSAEQLFENFL